MRQNIFGFSSAKRFAGKRSVHLGILGLAVGCLFAWSIFFGAPGVSPTTVFAQQQEGRGTAEMLAFALNLNAGSEFAVFGGHGVRNTGTSRIRGNVGSTGPIEGVAGFPDGIIPENRGQTKKDLRDALAVINQLPCTTVEESNLDGKTFEPGVYCLSSANLSGSMTVNANADPNARFVFRIAGSVNTDSGSEIRLDGGALATNVYFIAGSSITIGNESTIGANLIASDTVSIGARSTVTGKTIGVDGDVIIESSVLGAGTGHIEICKTLPQGDPIPVGTVFTFTVAGNSYLVPAGSCSAPIEVAAGNVTITEAVRANTAVTSIVTNPASRRVSFSLGLRQVIVGIPEGDISDQTVVTFTNQTTRTGTLEICKRALGADVSGIFEFTVQGAPGQSFAVPVGFCSGPITTTILQIPNTTFTANVTELAKTNFRLEDVTTLPAGRLTGPFFPNLGFDANGAPLADNTNGGYANVILISGGTTSQQTTVNFFNRSLPGRVKVCKITADPNLIPLGTIFRFTVSGLAPTSPTQSLPGTPVTQTVDVPAGPVNQNGFCQFVPGTFIVGEPVLITETGLAPGQTLPPGILESMIRVSRIRASTAFFPTPVTVQTAGGPVVVSAPNPNLVARTAVIGARNTTAEVEFTNFIFRPAILKLCKIAGPGVPLGTNFTFSLATTNPLTSWPVSTLPVTVPAGSCTFVNGPFPASENFPGIGTFNFGTQVSVTEAAATGFSVTAITSPTGGPLTVDLANRNGTITLNQSALPNSLFNEITFTNAATAPNPIVHGVRYDFDGDGKSDMVIYRQGTWWYAASSDNGAFRARQFGLATDRVVPADYDGDGTTDFAIYRNGEWHVLGSTSGYKMITFGLPTDILQPGDFDGDGKADFVVYRPSDSTWYMQLSRDGFRTAQFGIPTDSPQAADYDGDGRMDLAVYRSGTWYILGSTDGFRAVQFGLANDTPVPADYDGDGKADVAVFRGGTWHLLRSSLGYISVPFGIAGDTPVPADYDGDGRTDLSVYRSSSNVWHTLESSQASSVGGGYSSTAFGQPGDVLMRY